METFPYKAGTIQVRLSIWDIMGNWKVMGHLGDAYFDGAGGGLAVFDVTRPDTLEGLEAWIKAVRSAESRVPILVLGNKTDVADLRVVNDEEAGQLCQSLDLPYLPSSAMTGLNVEPALPPACARGPQDLHAHRPDVTSLSHGGSRRGELN